MSVMIAMDTVKQGLHLCIVWVLLLTSYVAYTLAIRVQVFNEAFTCSSGKQGTIAECDIHHPVI